MDKHSITEMASGLAAAFGAEKVWVNAADLGQIQRERDEALAALRELVDLKNIKDTGDDALMWSASYPDRKPLAWEEARRIVASLPPIVS